MKTYFRILSYAKPIGRYLPPFIIFTLLSVLFSLIYFSMLIPVLNVLFNQVAIESQNTYPQFKWTVDYFKDLFNYYFIDIIQSYGKADALLFVTLIIIVSVLLANLFRYLAGLTLATVRVNVLKNLRMSVFNKVSELHLGYFNNERKGDILSRMSNDVQEVENSVVSTLKVVFREPAIIIGYFFLLFSMSFKLTFFTLIVFPVSGIFISEIAKRLKRKAIQSQESQGRLLGIIDETLSGMRIIKAFTARNYILSKFQKEVTKYSKINISMARKNELASPASEFMGVVVVGCILLYGGNLVLRNESTLSASEFITYIGVFSQILVPAKSISSAFSNIQRGLASGERIFKIIDTSVEIKDKPNAVVVKGFKNAIQFKDVSFAYEKEFVLKNINLTIQKGKTVALVGSSGGGKSTLADLVARFYDPTEGDVCIDDIPLTDCNTDSVRKLMGIVTQESILFNDTIFNNIAFGIPDAKEEDVIKAAQIANAHDFIMQTELGYQTVIGERGSKLSGGQRQRISIARAVLKNPPILILDEATSALDSESEKLVQEALTNLMKNRTSIVIAHRLSTIQHADEIIVIQNGEITERGTHEELIDNEGFYKKLNSMQSVS